MTLFCGKGINRGKGRGGETSKETFAIQVRNDGDLP